MKYIRTNKNEVIIFSRTINHCDVADNFNLSDDQIKSAGFIVFDDITCYGESISLGVKSNSIDNVIVKDNLDNIF